MLHAPGATAAANVSCRTCRTLVLKRLKVFLNVYLLKSQKIKLGVICDNRYDFVSNQKTA